MICTQVFQRNGAPWAHSPVQCSTVEAAAAEGRELAERNPAVWGAFLYARPVVQQLIQLDVFYKLKPKLGLSQLNYRRVDEDLFAPFDYLRLTGPQSADVRFPLEWQHESGGTVRLDASFSTARAFKFLDMCRDYVARFVLQDNRPLLQFFPEHLQARAPTYEIALRKVL
ncbi:hypothetical protein F6X40_24145 [Paraburkholderia sp. UCT31]|uniref:hypothetical protein n=1 Tax=Paraburkholderia sp. UCT31 TaxID=2615209 RepID=UPI00165531A1|nr:hypothetical protein [Paraburkholderia sp. UCT31]MBC8739809.1 hypothetical protein [Paraburkholderia sp. UCT31]